MRPSPPPPGGLIPLDTYGDGGFRIDGLFRKGSVILLPGSVVDWPASEIGAATSQDFAAVLAVAGDLEFILIGCGRQIQPIPRALRDALEAAGLGIELMSTASAARTYNHLMSDGRSFAAALIAVE